jgi:hypothetical protein
MTTVEPMTAREIRQTVAALASCLPTEHAEYIRALPQDQFATVAEAYVAARSSDARVPRDLLVRIQAEIMEHPVAS